MKSYCPYCMHPVQPGTPCGFCGKNPADYAPSSHHFPPGTLLKDRYLVGRVLGEGGFGITYLGLDTRLERKVAIKEYFPTSFVRRETSLSLEVTCYTDVGKDFYEKGRDQFLVEARTMAKLEDIPEIVRVLDFFPANNTAYIVMEFLEGCTLKELTARQGRIPAKTMLDMLEPVLRAMEAMHAAGVIHRDISPDNLMQLKNGKVKLMDFGCARDIEGGRTMTVTLKHGFAPMEQYTGHGQGPWSDVYALCATVYYCLTGKVPPRSVERSDSEQDPLIPPTRLGAALTPAQEKALLTGLAVKARNRWQSAASLYAALYGRTMDGFPWTPPPEDPDRTVGETEYVTGDEAGRRTTGGADGTGTPTDTVKKQPSPWRSMQWKLRVGAAAVILLAAAAVGVVLFLNSRKPAFSSADRISGNPSQSTEQSQAPSSAPAPEPSPSETPAPAETEDQGNQNKLPGIGGVTAAPAGSESPEPSDSQPPASAGAQSPSPSQAGSQGGGGQSPASSSPSQPPASQPSQPSASQPSQPPASQPSQPASQSPEPSPDPEPAVGDSFVYGDYQCEYSYHSGVDGLALMVTYTGSASSVSIPSEINGYPVCWVMSFGNNSAVESLTIQNSHGYLCYTYSFSGCTNLKSVFLGAGVRVGESAFAGCSSLTSASFGAYCQIGDCAFQNDTALSSVTVGRSCTIGEDAFAGCSSLTSVSLPDSCVYDWQAFPDGCTVTGGVSDVL